MGQNTAVHGGQSFAAIGEDFAHLERAGDVVTADVLDAWFDPAPGVIRKILDHLPFLLKSSPPVDARGLVRAIAEKRGVPEECVLTGGGSSELIFSCLPRLVGGAKKALILDPTYGEYRHVFEKVLGLETLKFELRKEEGFVVDADRLIAQVLEQRPDVIGLVNPNSPTGQHCPRGEALRFLDAIPESTLVIVDETYAEYAGESLEAQAARRSNLVVLKSMSKVYALSGARVGYLVACAKTVTRLKSAMPPWSVGLIGQVAAVEALNDPDYYRERYKETHVLRAGLANELARIPGVTVYPSVCNFVLVEVLGSAQEIADRMAESNVFVRNCDSMSDRFRDRFLRIAVKDHAQNERIVQVLKTHYGCT